MPYIMYMYVSHSPLSKKKTKGEGEEGNPSQVRTNRGEISISVLFFVCFVSSSEQKCES